ncbi:MAG: phosphodiester glycosidase family protein [Myxococcales bacterium]|nr:phosphodiester glycosidase family protein [Myxococcales bacterium]
MVVTTLSFLGASYDVVTVDLDAVSLTLEPVHSAAELPPDELLAATNAGIFHSPEVPVGWTVAAGEQIAPLERGSGFGNFYLRPNGVFLIDDDGARVLATEHVDASRPVLLATQSGPALVLEGRIHPAFRPASNSLKIRNAVGVLDARTVVLVKSREPVRLYDLASLFVDELHVDDALYLDGTISSLWSEALPDGGSGRADERYAAFLVVRGSADAAGSCLAP